MFGGLKQKFAWLSPRLLMAAALFLIPTSANAQDYTSGLVAHWRLNDASGSATATEAIGGATGTLLNMDPNTDWVSGHVGGALEFTGVDQAVQTTYTAALGDFTACAWFYAGVNAAGNRRILDKDHVNGFWLGSDTNLTDWGGGIMQNTFPYGLFVTLPTGQWNHICTTRSGSTQTVIGNGGAATNSQAVSNLPTDTSILTLGTSKNLITPTDFYTGLIDDVRIYNRALTLADVAALYAVGSVAPLPCNAAHAGVLLYNSDLNVLQYCNATDWLDTGPRENVVSGCANPGDECDDGSVYAGLSPDGNTPMFVTHCDAGQTWSGAACTGSASLLGWNNNNAGSSFTTTSIGNLMTGAANTQALIALDADDLTAGIQPHLAAQYCADLNINGQDDWYLPARNETLIMYNNRASIGNFAAADYWTSSEYGTTSTYHRSFVDGSTTNTGKQSNRNVRCARKAALATGACASPAGVPGEVNYNYSNAVMQYCNGANWINMGPAVTGSGPAASVPATGLVGYWAFDEGTGTTANNSAGSSNGTLNNMVAGDWVAGINGGALDFDGVNDYVGVPYFAALNPGAAGSGTWAAWIKTNGVWGTDGASSSDAASIMSWSVSVDNAIFFTLAPPGALGVQLKNSAGTFACNYALTRPVLVSNQWHHVAVTFSAANGAVNTLYMDGAVLGTCTNAIALNWTANNNPLYIGDAGTPHWEEFAGQIDDVRIYNTILTPAQMLALYQGTGGSVSVPTHCSDPGDICADGTVYAGTSPDGNVKMYTTPCDDGMVWNGTTCIGARNTYYFKNDNVVGTAVDTALVNCTNGGTEATCRTGASNTAFLATADASSAGGVQPHLAAQRCDSLTANGHSDWYMPSIAELDELYVNLIAPHDPDNPTWADGAGGGSTVPAAFDGPFAATFDLTGNVPGGLYRSSSELDSLNTWSLRFGGFGGQHTGGSKLNLPPLRCVRKGGSLALGVCASPAGVGGEMVYNADHNLMQYCNGTDWVGIEGGDVSGGPAAPVTIVDSFEGWASGGGVNVAPDDWTVTPSAGAQFQRWTGTSTVTAGTSASDGTYGFRASLDALNGTESIVMTKNFDLTGLDTLKLDLAGWGCPCQGQLSLEIRVNGVTVHGPAILSSAPPATVTASFGPVTGTAPVEIRMSVTSLSPFSDRDYMGFFDNLRLEP